MTPPATAKIKGDLNRERNKEIRFGGKPRCRKKAGMNSCDRESNALWRSKAKNMASDEAIQSPLAAQRWSKIFLPLINPPGGGGGGGSLSRPLDLAHIKDVDFTISENLYSLDPKSSCNLACAWSRRNHAPLGLGFQALQEGAGIPVGGESGVSDFCYRPPYSKLLVCSSSEQNQIPLRLVPVTASRVPHTVS